MDGRAPCLHKEVAKPSLYAREALIPYLESGPLNAAETFKSWVQKVLRISPLLFHSCDPEIAGHIAQDFRNLSIHSESLALTMVTLLFHSLLLR